MSNNNSRFKFLEGNLFFDLNSFSNINGIYIKSKDDRVRIENKEYDNEHTIELKISNVGEYLEAKKITELIAKILIDNKGYLRDFNEQIFIQTPNKNSTVISIDEEN